MILFLAGVFVGVIGTVGVSLFIGALLYGWPPGGRVCNPDRERASL